MSKVTQAREELKARLLSVDGLDAVLNPVEARDSAKRPASGVFAALWSLPRTQTLGRDSVIWQCPFGIDVAVPWDDSIDMESELDDLTLRITYAMSAKWPVQLVNEIDMTAASIAYPEQGSRSAVISFEITLRVVDSQS